MSSFQRFSGQNYGEGCTPCHSSPPPPPPHTHAHEDTFFAKAGTRNQGSLGIRDGSQASFTGQDLVSREMLPLGETLPGMLLASLSQEVSGRLECQSVLGNLF